MRATSSVVRPGTLDRTRRFTYESLCEAIGETTEPHELWNGRLIREAAPGYGHQRIVLWFARALSDFAEPRGLGRVVTAPIDLVLAPDTCLQPDVAFVAKANLHRVKRAIQGPADLVAEVVSPWRPRSDWERKRRCYERFGVREYWILDPKARIVEVLALAAGGSYRSAGRWRPGGTARSRLLKGFEIDLPVRWPASAIG